MIKISHQIRARLFGLTFLFSGLAQAEPLQIDFVPSIHRPYCQDAIVRNLTSTTLHFILNYVVKGDDGSHYSGSTPIGGTTFNGGGNTGYYMTGLSPGEARTVPVNNIAAVSCNVHQTVSASYTSPYDVDAHNRRVSSNESGERRALGTAIDNWNNEDKQRKQEREAQKRAEAARLTEEEKRRKQQEYRQTMERQMESARRDGEKTMGDIQAWRARQEAEYQAERQRIQAEMARGQIEREAYNREAQAKATRAQAEWQAQQAAAQRAAQAEQARQAALAAERAAKERRRQEQWQQQVSLTSSLLQGSIQNSENALAASRAQLNETVTTYDTEDKALADIIAKAKAAAQNKK